MHDNVFVISTVAVISLVTIALRFFPFLIFRGNKDTPTWLNYLGKGIPYSAIAMLVIYCLKGLQFKVLSGWVPDLMAVSFVVALHLWKRNTLLSIFTGTIFYMLLVQFVFV